jgi:hypothetical protein
MPTKPNLTPEVPKPLYSDTHLMLGYRCPAGDADLMEWMIKSGEIEFVAVTEYKDENSKKITDAFLRVPRAVAKRMSLPLLIILDYLKRDIPMYYVCGGDQLGKEMMAGIEPWMTVREFSRFLHRIRGLDWNASEEIDAKKLFAPEKLGKLPVGIFGAKTLGELPDERPADLSTYVLPEPIYTEYVLGLNGVRASGMQLILNSF